MRKFLFLVLLITLSFCCKAQDLKEIYSKSISSLVTLKSVDVLGFGFFIDKDLIVTNYQVINKARIGAAKAVLNNDISVDVLGYVAADEELNLVILKLNYGEGIPLKLNITKPVAASKLYLFNHKKDDDIDIIEGNMIELKDYGTIQMIQMSASIILRNSGFPVLNKNGDVVGVSVPSPVQDTNTNFAIPIEKVKILLANRKSYVEELSALNPPQAIIQTNTPEKSELVEQNLNQGNAKFLAKDYKGAEEKFTNAINFAPSDPDAYVFRGQTRYMQMKFKEALEDFNKAIDLAPDFAEAYDLRGVTKGELGDKEGACEDWQKSYELGFNEAFKLIKEFCDLEKEKEK
jgi:tetratricopeptide (TPR) repeat protein